MRKLKFLMQISVKLVNGVDPGRQWCQKGRFAQGAGLFPQWVPFHRVFPVISSQHESNPSHGEKKARVLCRRPEDYVVSFFLRFLASSASSISNFLPLFGGEECVCMVRLFLSTLYLGPAVRAR